MTTITRAALVRRQGGPFELEDVELDEPRPDELLVRIVACGVCHTDMAARDGLWDVGFPAVFGHEGAGIVERVGDGVRAVRPGDSVVLSFSSCGKCPGCLEGNPARCSAFDELNFSYSRPDGSPTILDLKGKPVGGCFFGQSSFARHSLTRERNLIPVEVSGKEELALFASLGCGVQAGAGTILNELKPCPGHCVAVFGAGAVGLSALMAAHLLGVDRIVVVDIVESRLELAGELGADIVFNGRDPDLSAKLRKAVGAVDFAVDTTGRSKAIELALGSLGPEGKLSLLGIPADPPGERVSPRSPDPGQTVFHSIAGDSNPQKFIPFLIKSYREGKFPFTRLIRQYPASEINDSVRDSLAGTTIKPVLRF